MRDPRRVEYITRLAEIDEEDSAQRDELKKQYETDPEFMPESLGITQHTDMPYLYAHGGKFQLVVEFTYTEGISTSFQAEEGRQDGTSQVQVELPGPYPRRGRDGDTNRRGYAF